jgi:hypothetical protein
MPGNTDSTASLAADAAVTSSLLGLGRTISLTSGLVLLMATAFWIQGHSIRSIAYFSSILVALLQGYFAQRVRFDAAIFSFWAKRWNGSVDPVMDLKAFDTRIGRQPSTADSAQTNLAQRRRGALRLLRYQIFSGLLQLLLITIALWP